MGISAKTMLTGEQVIRDKISNEGTWDGGYRPTVNIIGLWLNQELRRSFEREGKSYSFAQMNEMAAEAAAELYPPGRLYAAGRLSGEDSCLL